MSDDTALIINDPGERQRSVAPAAGKWWTQLKAHLPGTASSPLSMLPYWVIGSAALYLLAWSKLFEPIRADTALFLVVACVLFLGLSGLISTRRIAGVGLPLSWWPVALITAYFAGAVVGNGGIPILQILRGTGYDVYGFGIDGLHIFMLCFTGYYGVRACKAFIDRKRATDLLILLWMIALLSMIANRSAVSFLVFACAILFVRSRRFGWMEWGALLVALLLFAYIFGVFGDVRLAFQIEQEEGIVPARDAVLRFTRASDAFTDTGLSPSWLWAYLYFVSPLANLNEAFGFAAANPCTDNCNTASLVFSELLPDSIGDRLAAFFHVPAFSKADFIIAPDITASTAFGSAVGQAGMAGGLAVLLFLAVICCVSVWLLKGSVLKEEGLAILATIVFFSFFENMIAYTALFGQLCIVLVSALIVRTRRRARTGLVNPRTQW